MIYVSDTRYRALGTNVYVPTVVFLVLFFALWLVLSRTVVGRRLYALGGNEEAARLSGIRTDGLKWLAYCISAVCSAVAGVLYIADQSVADPQKLAVAYELNAIAAAVVGGVQSGRRGRYGARRAAGMPVSHGRDRRHRQGAEAGERHLQGRHRRHPRRAGRGG